jgi:hypothetical protein
MGVQMRIKIECPRVLHSRDSGHTLRETKVRIEQRIQATRRLHARRTVTSRGGGGVPATCAGLEHTVTSVCKKISQRAQEEKREGDVQR